MTATNEAINAWMPIYWGDYLRDTAHLSSSEHGAYLLMIGHYWTTGAPLPDDDDKLRRIARMERPEWKKAKATISEFFDIAGGCWRHKRIDVELDQWRARKQKNKARATNAASKRWAGPNDAESNATSMQEAQGKQCLSGALHHSPSSNPTTTEGTDTSRGAETDAARAVVKVFMAARNERWPDAMPANNFLTQVEHARAMLAEPGATVELVSDLVKAAVAKWRDPKAPGGVGAFRQSIANQIAQHVRATAQTDRRPTAQQTHAPNVAFIDHNARIRARLESYKKDGKWPYGDPEPTSRYCQIDQRLMLEVMGEEFMRRHHAPPTVYPQVPAVSAVQ